MDLFTKGIEIYEISATNANGTLNVKLVIDTDEINTDHEELAERTRLTLINNIVPDATSSTLDKWKADPVQMFPPL
jgi:hypothetical protein